MALNLNNLPINDRGEVWSGGQMVGMMPGGDAPVDRSALAQAVMAQQGMPPPQQGPMMGGGRGYALGTFQGGPDPNAPGSMAGQYYARSLYNSSEDRGSYDPVGGATPANAFGRTGDDTSQGSRDRNEAQAQDFAMAALGRESMSDRSMTAPGWGMGPIAEGSPAQSQYGSSTFAQPGATPVTTSTFSPPGRDMREFNVTDIPIQGSAPIVPGWSPGSALPPGWGQVATAPPPGGQPPGGRSAPVGTFATGPDPNAPGSTVGTPAGWGGVADPTGFGGFGAFGGFSPGMAGQGGWGGGFEGSGFNSSGDYSGGYDTAAGDVSR